MEKVIAKCNVTELIKFQNGNGKVVLEPVCNNCRDNMDFWRYTPSGRVELQIDNPEAFKVFEDMGEFYLTFEKA